MDFDLSERQRHWRDRVVAFTEKYIEPAEATYHKQEKEGDRWKVIPVLDELKKKARAEGLWNMFMPPNDHEDDEFRGAGLTNLEYAFCAEHMGRIKFASEVFNCSAPDTGNMEVFIRYGNKEQKRKWLRPLKDVKVPVENLLLGEGRGFEIAQGRLGPGRIHHCMRTIGVAEVCLEKMVNRLTSRVAFGKHIIEQSVWEQRIAEARIDIERT